MIENLKSTYINRLIDSAGKTNFLKYFYDFEALKETEVLIEIFEQNKEPWNKNGKKQVASNGKRIFKENRALEALEFIILNTSNEQTKNDAIQIYNNYFSTQVVDSLKEQSSDEKKVMVKYRLQQSKFRKELILHWQGCSITGLKYPEILIASHIKPYSESDSEEKYNVNNGLLLSPLYDKLFDYHIITFDTTGRIILPKSFDQNILKALNISGEEQLRLDKLTNETKEYLKYHNDKFDKKNNKNRI